MSRTHGSQLAELRSLLGQPVVQEYVAAMAALRAREADRNGEVELAALLWRFVRRTRVTAMRLRVLAKVRDQSAL